MLVIQLHKLKKCLSYNFIAGKNCLSYNIIVGKKCLSYNIIVGTNAQHTISYPEKIVYHTISL